MYIPVQLIFIAIAIIIYLGIIYKISKNVFEIIRATAILIFEIITVTLSISGILLIIKLFI